MTIIVIDPGHGQSWSGIFERPLCKLSWDKKKVIIANKYTLDKRDADPKWYREDMAMLALARETKKVLDKMGYTVYITRNDERGVHQYIADFVKANQWKRENWSESKWIREFCQKVESDVFVSLHSNALKSQKANGAIGFFKTPAGLDLAEEIIDKITSSLDIKERRGGVQKRKFAKFSGHSKGRACLVEAGFHTNPKDLAILNDPKEMKKIGKAIAEGINSYCLKTFK